MAMNSKEYWKERARQDKLKVIKRGENGINDLKKLLKTNLKDVQKQIEAFYDKYAEDYGQQLSFKEFEKYKKDLKANVKKYPKDITLQKILKEDAPKYRIDRLRELETQLQTQLTEITAVQEAKVGATLKDVANTSNTLMISRLSGATGLTFNKISQDKLLQIINQTWVGRKNWSARIWADRELVGKKLTKILQTGVPQGKALQSMARDLASATNNSFNNAFRIIRTETSHIDGQVTLQGYKEAEKDFEKPMYYIYDAFLDDRTSTECRELNGKRFKVSDAEVGVNYPPRHVSCRSTTYLDV